MSKSPYQALYTLIQTLPQPDGTMQPAVQSAVKNHQSNNLSIIMAFPLKVGGTFLRRALMHLLEKNYDSFLVRGSYASTDQARDLYFPSMLNNHVTQTQPPSAAIAHCHMYATQPVTSMIEAFNMPVLVNARNIFDTLLSYYEMLEADTGKGLVARSDFVLQTHSNYHELPEDERRWHLVNVAPIWYSRFYAYWIRYTHQCLETTAKPPFWTKFDELRNDGPLLLAKIAKHTDPKHDYSSMEVITAFDKALKEKKQLRFNKGLSGRGAEYFNAEEKAAITKLMAGGSSIRKQELENLGIL